MKTFMILRTKLKNKKKQKNNNEKKQQINPTFRASVERLLPLSPGILEIINKIFFHLYLK